ncbi:hypothetical protein TREMEDRAFT_57761 [Tremella mesenterica DSM 1558]|uniref:uncharacterized protein n=1 Tax=Tremella mesenterica (strain ATCC 24925 / CBS 8224 / DSM 1558 / NBRC 9311 / NRRL Y-6157 / RJB 2259-6 / UBC 559-6) TaxID=578456 RepID=UPI00032C1463|nr:uncharacterized protein TREMEDRAFT_57761 [Tremella mesenterica DSM 1558]EIW66606.1 hypothetical protein TREMEDRAFT_57761 [Tremella mesenterica DSM 1558]
MSKLLRPCSSSSRRHLSYITPRRLEPIFFVSHRQNASSHLIQSRSPEKGKGREVDNGYGPTPTGEAEVDDLEWDMRVAKAMLHLQDTLPLLFDPTQSSSSLFPSDIFSKNVILKLPSPLPLKISSLSGYQMAFSIARNGMQALHTNLHTSLDRMSFSPSPSFSPTLLRGTSDVSTLPKRQKQIRVLLQIYGKPRLPPHKETIWHTSSMYSFSPYSGLINLHEVETIRPLPGEGVAEWLMTHLLNLTHRAGQGEGGIPAPGGAASVTAPEVQVVRCGYAEGGKK